MNKPDAIPFARDMIAVQPPLRLLYRHRPPRDGLYRVASRKRVIGGFLASRRRVVRCSPALRKHIHVWQNRYAQYWGSLEDCF